MQSATKTKNISGLSLLGVACLSVSCGKLGFFGSQPDSRAAQGKPQPTATVVPPIPVVGSYLTTLITDADGSPLRNTNVFVVESQLKTKTNDVGEFNLPVLNLNSDTLSLRISKSTTDSGSEPSSSAEETFEARLPIELRVAVEAARSNKKEIRSLPLRWGLGMPPENSTTQRPDSATALRKLASTSLPPRSLQKSHGVLSRFENASNDTSARLRWEAPTGALVEILFSTEYSTIAGWNSDPGTALPAGMRRIVDYEQCNDVAFRDAATGTLQAAPGKCGIQFSTDPSQHLLQDKTYYFKVSAHFTSSNRPTVLVSAVEKIAYRGPTQPTSPNGTPAPLNNSWLQYHTQIQSCNPSYFGPTLLEKDEDFKEGEDLYKREFDSKKFGAFLPQCDQSRKNTVFCVGRSDGSQSGCTNCEQNLFFCP
ncbi:MAG: hypothetical protein RI932_474 [Pseudomonadota bacterium]|jgi:hypothetical protein